VRTDGTLACWGYDGYGQATPPAGTFSQVSAGGYHTCGVRTDGTLACWGSDGDGQATPPAGTFTEISAGYDHTCGVRTDGTLACWGNNDYGQATPPAGTFSQVSAAGLHTCGVKTDGTLACWGWNLSGQATPPVGTFTQISGGWGHTCGVRTDGTLDCWGNDSSGQATPPAGTFSQVSAGNSHNCAVRTDGTLACWGWNLYGQATPPAGTFSQVSGGAAHTCGVRTDGTLACWGDDYYGQATPPTEPTPTPTATPTATATDPPTVTATPTPTPTPRLYVVNSTGDGPDSSPGDKVCNDGSGHCTLRAVIQEANADWDPSTISFNIGGGGVQTIIPGSALPAITQPVIIDGTTQPGYAGAPIIELNGASAGAGAIGLVVNAGPSTVSGLVINRFAGNGVEVGSGGGNVISGNYIGTNVAGTVALGNANGVLIQSSGNIIGGTTAGARNVISGNNGNGVLIFGASATGNVVEGNYIGTSATATVALGNHFAGVGVLNDASNSTVGGTAPGAGNVISGNGTGGVGTAGGAGTGLVVQGNFIGTDPSGTLALGNGGDGVGLASESNCIVGGTASGARNTIAHNGGDGVSVNTVNNAIRGNSIFSNTGLGIDLGPNGVTPNDLGDGDTGANNLQNFPVLTLAVTGSTSIQGSLNSTPSTQFVLHFYSNASCDPSGYGEGESFLGSTTVTTNGGGNASFSVAFPQTVPPGRFITATATDPGGNTSEFSACIQVASVPIPTPTPTPAPVIDRLAGTPGKFDFKGDGGPAQNAWLNDPHGSFEVTSSNTLYFADTGNNRVRRIHPNEPTGTITTVAGGGSCTPPNVGDGGPATSACLNNPYDVFVDGPGNIYIADTGNNRIRKVNTAGTITTVAGTGVAGYFGDGGLATSARLNGPRGVAVDASGNIYIADTENHRIRRVDAASGMIITVAGDGIAGFSGDGVLATATHLNRPHDVYMYGRSGDFLIADTLNNRIRRVDAFTGVILTFAGSGLASFGGDGGPGTLAHLNGPEAVAVDSADLGLPNVVVADTQNHRIRRVNGHTSVISTIAGNGTPGSGGDGGDPTLAQLYLPAGISVGSLTGSDTGNSTLRAIQPGGEPGGKFSGFSCTVGSAATADWVLLGFVLGLILARRRVRGLILWIRAAAAPPGRRGTTG
jgi:CSLREA domain-containing protein